MRDENAYAREIAEQYRNDQEIETGWNWELILKSLESEAWEYDPDSQMMRRMLFAGTVFAIMPSGKFWTFWASRNVDEDEAEADIAFREALDAEAAAHGCSITNGEGDPCDLFVEQYRDCDEVEEAAARAEREEHKQRWGW